MPVLGLTATATKKVKEDIVKNLRLRDVLYFQSSFNRPNLFYEIRVKKEVGGNKCDDLVQVIRRKFDRQSGIIYCLARKECEKLANDLEKNYGIKCSYYHADMNQ